MLKDCLLIDDDLDDQEIFLMALHKIDSRLKCSFANNGVEGLAVLSDHLYSPAFIFLDINMPKMNGIECLRQIKMMDHLKACQVIVYSTSTDAAIIRQCKELGADDFLSKPSGLGILVASLTNILKG